ncbi:hypothetical protein [Microbacterium sp. JAI119]|uniref:hypothetical protein n=1 Tax=Microbacterium sp. JAI119 TaxID=2723062 RepID=UPI0015C78F8E|nr:hypothetical protein [Microbacterium sp. JAI119]NYF29015.1 hypothetical protein [Microbacterium sp. JAI119]
MTGGPLNIERENAAAAHVKADRDEVYSNNEDRVHNAFVSGAEWERDGHEVGGIAGLPPTATPTSADAQVSYDEATAALEKFREVETIASDIDAMWAVLVERSAWSLVPAVAATDERPYCTRKGHRNCETEPATRQADAWDQGYWLGINGHTGPGNPYRESNHVPLRGSEKQGNA